MDQQRAVSLSAATGSGTLNVTGGGTVSNTHWLHRLQFRLDGHGDGGRHRLDVDQQRHLYVGYSGSGTLNITGGGSVSNTNGYIGYNSGSTGMVTVDGTGSTWTNSGTLYVGNSGGGTLNIHRRQRGYGRGAPMSATTRVPRAQSISQRRNADDRVAPSIADATDGHRHDQRPRLVSDVDLVFDSTHGLRQSVHASISHGQNITVNLDLASNPSSNGDLGAG